jgi:hypothetical protein
MCRDTKYQHHQTDKQQIIPDFFDCPQLSDFVPHKRKIENLNIQSKDKA